MKRLDLFGSQIQFRFQGQKSFNTSFGVFFTLGIISIISLRFAILLFDIYNRKNPLVISQQRQVDSPEKFVMDSNTLPLAFGLQGGDSLEHYIDPSIYTVVAQQHTKIYYVDEKGQTQYKIQATNITVSRCTESSFKNPATKEAFLQLPYTDLFCLDPEQVMIEGDFTQQNFSQFQIYLYPCSGQGCGDTKKIGRGYFAIYFQDTIVKPDEKENPFQYFHRDLFWTISSKTPKEVNMYFVNNYVESDFGWVTSDIQKLRHPSFSDQDNSYTADVGYFFMLNMRFQKQKENIFTRNYKNLTTAISEIGGFAQSILAIGFIICTTLSEIMLNKSIINEAFDFKIKSLKNNPQQLNNIQQEKQIQNKKSHQQVEPNLKKQQVQIKDIKSQKNTQIEANQNIYSSQRINQKEKYEGNIKSQNMIFNSPLKQAEIQYQAQESANQISSSQNQSSIQFLSSIVKKRFTSTNQNQAQTEIQSKKSIQDTERKQNIDREKNLKQTKQISDEQFKKLLNKERSDMNLSIMEYIKYFFWPFGQVKKKKQIIDYSVQKLYYHLDLMYVIKKLLEVDKLKELVMDKDQIQLFEYISKPIISEEDVFNQLDYDQVNQQSQQKYSILYQDNRSEIQKTQDAYQSYQKILNRDQQSLMDQKILRHLDPQLLSIFNYQEQQDQLQNIVKKNDQINIQPFLEQNNQISLENQLNCINKISFNHQINAFPNQQLNILYNPRSEIEILEEKQQSSSSSSSEKDDNYLEDNYEQYQVPFEENNQVSVNRNVKIPQNQIKKQYQ